jgi:hypothetical protein
MVPVETAPFGGYRPNGVANGVANPTFAQPAASNGATSLSRTQCLPILPPLATGARAGADAGGERLNKVLAVY